MTVAIAAALAACGDSEPVLDAQAARGKKVAYDKNCTSCHTADGSRAEGPTWKSLYGSTVLLSDGTSVVADDAYLTRSVTNPRSQQVAGYRTAMPTTPMTEDEIAAVNAYIRALKGP